MKIQDIGFFIGVFILLILRKPQLCIIAGLLCFFFAIPLFATWTFFTAERLVWYGAAFVFIGIIRTIIEWKEKKI
jgi:hypothetical protein